MDQYCLLPLLPSQFLCQPLFVWPATGITKLFTRDANCQYFLQIMRFSLYGISLASFLPLLCGNDLSERSDSLTEKTFWFGPLDSLWREKRKHLHIKALNSSMQEDIRRYSCLLPWQVGRVRGGPAIQCHPGLPLAGRLRLHWLPQLQVGPRLIAPSQADP